jgi:hypothetical protein
MLDQFIINRCRADNTLKQNVYLMMNFFVAFIVELKEFIFNVPNFDEFLGKNKNIIMLRFNLFRGKATQTGSTSQQI